MLSPAELMLVAGGIALLFGAKKLPEFARSLGKAKTEFKKGLTEGEAEEATQAGAAQAGKEKTAKPDQT